MGQWLSGKAFHIYAASSVEVKFSLSSSNELCTFQDHSQGFIHLLGILQSLALEASTSQALKCSLNFQIPGPHLRTTKKSKQTKKKEKKKESLWVSPEICIFNKLSKWLTYSLQFVSHCSNPWHSYWKDRPVRITWSYDCCYIVTCSLRSELSSQVFWTLFQHPTAFGE